MAARKKVVPKKAPKPKHKPAPFVPKVGNLGGAPKGNKNAVGNKGGGRPTEYQGEKSCCVARKMVELGAPDHAIAEALGISVTTFHAWRHTHVKFSEACQMGRAALDRELKRTAGQRALGYTYETEKVFQTGVRMEHTEHVPPDTGMLKWLLANHLPDEYRDKIDVNLKSDERFLLALEAMNEQALFNRAARARPVGATRMLIEHEPTTRVDAVDRRHAAQRGPTGARR